MPMIHKPGLFLFLLFFVSGICAQNNSICTHIGILASDSLQGRKPGSPGGEAAARYIQQQMKENRLTMLFDDGFQYFDVVTDVKAGSKNSLSYQNHQFIPQIDFMPYSYSRDTAIDAPCVFAGYGLAITADSLHWDDYQGLDVKNKWVMVLRGQPGNYKKQSPFDSYSSDRNKMLTARDRGAAGILLVSGPSLEKDDALLPMTYEKSPASSAIPMINITRKTANLLLAESGKTVSRLQQLADSAGQRGGFQLNAKVDASVEVVHTSVKTANVAAIYMMRPAADEYIVIGAHYDHLGLGGKGSGSRNPDTVAVHNGADDNASGTALVLEAAKRLSESKWKGKYNIIFVAFSAEEFGLLGSSWFVQHLPVDKRKIKLMLNFDMVGRLNEYRTLSVGGTGTFADAEKILSAVNDTNKLKLAFSTEGYGPSDHASFYADSIPVLYFNTGVHPDYHLPADDVEKINCTGLSVIADFVVKTIEELSLHTYDLAFHEAGPRTKSSQRTGLKVTLGIMPDFARQDVKGVAVGAVNSDGPAQRGGMKKGDVITAIGEKTVNDIYEYMERLKTLSAGSLITVDVMRNGNKEVLLIQL